MGKKEEQEQDQDKIILSKKKLGLSVSIGILGTILLLAFAERDYFKEVFQPNTKQFQEGLEEISYLSSDGTTGILSQEDIEKITKVYEELLTSSEEDILKKYNYGELAETLKVLNETDEENASIDTMLKSLLWKEQKYWFIISKKKDNIQAIQCDVWGRDYLETKTQNMVTIPAEELYAGIEMGDYFLIEYDFENSKYALISKDDVDINIVSAYKTKKDLKIKIDSLTEKDVPKGTEIQIIRDLAIIYIDGEKYQVNKKQILDQIKDPKAELENLPKQPIYTFNKTMSKYYMKGNPNETFLGGEIQYDPNSNGLYIETYSLTKGLGIKMAKSNLIEVGSKMEKTTSRRAELDLATGYAGDEVDNSSLPTNNYIDTTKLDATQKEIIEENKGNLLNIFDDENETVTINFKGVKYDIIPDLLDPSKCPARSGEKINGPNQFMVHDTAWPGGSAKRIGQYFKDRAPGPNGDLRDVSSHFGLDFTTGNIHVYIPPTEKAVAAINKNSDVIHIECTIPQDTVEFTNIEWETLIDFSARISIIYDIDIDENFIRHCDTQADRSDPQCMNSSSKEKNNRWKEFKENVKKRKQDILKYQELAKQIESGQGYSSVGTENSSTSNIVNKLLNEAASHKGETNSDKRFSKKYGDVPSYIDNYCALYVMSCANNVGIPDDIIPQGSQYANCPTMFEWFKDNKRIRKNDGKNIPKSGDIGFLVDENGTIYHTFFIKGVSNGKISTWEGNSTNNQVLPFDEYYSIGNDSSLLYFADVDYSKMIDNRDYNYTGNEVTADDINIEGIGFSREQKEVIAKCYNILRAEGLDHIHACGILANIYKESSFNPESIADDGAKGLFQYTYITRKTNYEEYIEKYNNEHGTKGQPIEAQIQFALYGKGEKDKSDTYRKKDFATSYDAGDYWCREWERPANKEEQGKIRGANATKFEKGIPETKVQAQTNEEQSR